MLRTFHWGSMHSIRARTPLRKELAHQRTAEGHRGHFEHAAHLCLRFAVSLRYINMQENAAGSSRGQHALDGLTDAKTLGHTTHPLAPGAAMSGLRY